MQGWIQCLPPPFFENKCTYFLYVHYLNKKTPFTCKNSSVSGGFGPWTPTTALPWTHWWLQSSPQTPCLLLCPPPPSFRISWIGHWYSNMHLNLKWAPRYLFYFIDQSNCLLNIFHQIQNFSLHLKAGIRSMGGWNVNSAWLRPCTGLINFLHCSTVNPLHTYPTPPSSRKHLYIIFQRVDIGLEVFFLYL
jgi:hypothetical protein